MLDLGKKLKMIASSLVLASSCHGMTSHIDHDWPASPVTIPSIVSSRSYCGHTSNLAVEFSISPKTLKKGEVFQAPSMGGLLFKKPSDLENFIREGHSGKSTLYILPYQDLTALRDTTPGSDGGEVLDQHHGAGFALFFTKQDQICKSIYDYR